MVVALDLEQNTQIDSNEESNSKEKFDAFVGNISNIYNLDKNILYELWNKIKVSKTETCLYIFQKGNKTGCMCSKKVFNNSEFCENHYNQILKKLNKNKPKDSKPKDTKSNDSKPKDSKPKDTKPKDTKPKDTNSLNQIPVRTSKKKLDIKLNSKIGKYWNPRFRFIFNNQHGEYVIGIYREQCVQQLNINDLDICKKYNIEVNHDKEIIKNKYDSDDCDEGSLDCSSDSE